MSRPPSPPSFTFHRVRKEHPVYGRCDPSCTHAGLSCSHCRRTFRARSLMCLASTISRQFEMSQEPFPRRSDG